MAFVKSTRLDLASNRAAFMETSSLNDYFLCHHCRKKFVSKNGIKRHVFLCVASRTCKWCNIEFKNRGNLAVHSLHVHNDWDTKMKTLKNACQGCDRTFSNMTTLKLHIRREHYNFISKVPVYMNKKVNECWYEKVMNSDAIVKMTRVSPTTLSIQKYNGKPVDVEESEEIVDSTPFYSTGKRVKKITCEICKRKILARTFKKHFEERHGNFQKHHCNNCNKTFKRSYFFVRHHCHRLKKKRGT